MSDAQSWTVPISPRERFFLFALFASKAHVVDQTSGPKMRRAFHALRLGPIKVAADASGGDGEVSNRQALDTRPVLFPLTLENVAYVLDELGKVPRNAMMEIVVGDVFDRLEALRRPNYVPTQSDAPPYDPGTDDWTPEPTPAP